MTTIVSGFINIHKYVDYEHTNRSISEYIEYGKKLLELPYPKVIFLEQSTIDELDGQIFPNTTIITFEKHEMYLWKYRDDILKFKTSNVNGKDSNDYKIVIHQKTQWVANAINSNPYNTSNFVWIDFGIYHIVKNDEDFYKGITHIINTQYNDNSIRIPGVWNPIHITKNNTVGISRSELYYKHSLPMWYCCGGIFGGKNTILKIFNELVKYESIELVKQGILTWEVNTWYLVFNKYKFYMNWYYADHNKQMLYNY